EEYLSVMHRHEDYFEQLYRTCIDLLGPTDELLGLVESSIRSVLDKRQAIAWRMGVGVDQALRPPTLVRYLCSPEAIQEPVVDSPAPRVKTLSWGEKRDLRDEKHLPTRSVRAGEIPPELGWSDDLRQRWNELRLPV